MNAQKKVGMLCQTIPIPEIQSEKWQGRAGHECTGKNTLTAMSDSLSLEGVSKKQDTFLLDCKQYIHDL